MASERELDGDRPMASCDRFARGWISYQVVLPAL